MEKAIKIAIENGYNKINPNNSTFKYGFDIYYMNAVWENDFEEKYILPLHFVLLDPLFWQTLGKGLGWKTKEQLSKDGEYDTDGLKDEYFYKWRDIIYHLYKGGDVESFFKQYVKTP